MGRVWISTSGLSPWRPEVQLAGGPQAEGCWAYVPSPRSAESFAREFRAKAEKEAAAQELAACRDASDVMSLIASRANLLEDERSAWTAGAFEALFEGGMLIPPTHQFYRMSLAWPQRWFDVSKVVVSSKPYGYGWEVEHGGYADRRGHVWTANFGNKFSNERFLRGEVTPGAGAPWLGYRGTSKKKSTAALPIGERPRLVFDAAAHGKRRLSVGMMVSDYSSVRLPSVVPLLREPHRTLAMKARARRVAAKKQQQT